MRTDSNSTFKSYIVNRCNLFIKSFKVKSRKLLSVVSLIFELTVGYMSVLHSYMYHEDHIGPE